MRVSPRRRLPPPTGNVADSPTYPRSRGGAGGGRRQKIHAPRTTVESKRRREGEGTGELHVARRQASGWRSCVQLAQPPPWGGGANSERGDPTGRLGNWVGACCRLTAQPHRTKGQEPRPLERGRNVLGKTSIGRHLIRPGATRHRSGLRPKGGPPRVVHNESIFVPAFKNTIINCIQFVTCM